MRPAKVIDFLHSFTMNEGRKKRWTATITIKGKGEIPSFKDGTVVQVSERKR